MFLLQRRRVTTWASSARPAAAKASPARAAAATPQVRVVDEPAVCQSLGEGVYELPAMLPRAACARVVAEVSARVSNGSATDRGASLKTTDVYVRDLADAEDVYRARASAGRSPMSRTENRARELVSTQALDAGCHLVELCTGRLVTYERKKAFVITYDATSTKVRRGGARPFSEPPSGAQVNGRGLTKHKDRTENRTSQANTLLITLDCRDAYGGGGTKFYPPAAKKQPFVVRPARRPRRPSRGARDDPLTPRRSAAEA